MVHFLSINITNTKNNMKNKFLLLLFLLSFSTFYSNAQNVETTVQIIKTSKERIADLNAEAAKIGGDIESKKQDLNEKISQAKELAILTREAKKSGDTLKTEEAKQTQKKADNEVKVLKKELRAVEKSQKDILKEVKKISKAKNSVEKHQKNVTQSKVKLAKVENNLKKTTTQFEKDMLNRKLTTEKELKVKAKILKLETEVKELKIKLRQNEIELQKAKLEI